MWPLVYYSSNKLEMYIMAYKFYHSISSVNTWNHNMCKNDMECLHYCKGVENWFELLCSRLCCYLCSDLHVLFHRECYKLLWQSALTMVACCKNNWWNLKRPICVVSHMFTLIMIVIMFKKKRVFFYTLRKIFRYCKLEIPYSCHC
jgi:hypothetical protein